MPLFLVLMFFVLVSVGLVWYFLANDKGEKEPIIVLWLAAGLGMSGAFSAYFVQKMVLGDDVLLQLSSYSSIFSTMLTVSLIEESFKFIPLALLIYKRRFFNEHTDGIIYFAIAGLGFGLPENIIYTVNYGAEVGVARLFLTPLFHAATTGVVGYYLIKLKLSHKSPWWIGVPLAAMILLHAIYNSGLASGAVGLVMTSVLITIGLTASLFVLFVKAAAQDQDSGLSVVGNNSFCRSCGCPNPTHHLYCTRCGKHA